MSNLRDDYNINDFDIDENEKAQIELKLETNQKVINVNYYGIEYKIVNEKND